MSEPDPDYIGDSDLNFNQQLETNQLSKMAEKLVTPTFCSGINVYETFKKELDVWKKITKIPKKTTGSSCSSKSAWKGQRSTWDKRKDIRARSGFIESRGWVRAIKNIYGQILS